MMKAVASPPRYLRLGRSLALPIFAARQEPRPPGLAKSGIGIQRLPVKRFWNVAKSRRSVSASSSKSARLQ